MTRQSKPKSRVAKLRQLVHVARRQLALDDAEYQALLKGATGGEKNGKESTEAMDAKELWRVVEAMKKAGFVVKAKAGDIPLDHSETAGKIRFEWLQLKRYGELRNSSERSLQKYVKRITKVEHTSWLDDRQTALVIETLKKWVARVEHAIVNKAIASGALPPSPTGLRDIHDALRQCGAWNRQRQDYLDSYTPGPTVAKAAAGGTT